MQNTGHKRARSGSPQCQGAPSQGEVAGEIRGGVLRRGCRSASRPQTLRPRSLSGSGTARRKFPPDPHAESGQPGGDYRNGLPGMRTTRGEEMGFFVAWVVDEGPPVDDDTIASARGWYDWSQWAEGLGDAYPNVVRLAQDGELWPAEALAGLEEELKRLGKAGKGKPRQNVRHVSARLLKLLGDRPEGCVGLIITDGEAGGDEEED